MNTKGLISWKQRLERAAIPGCLAAGNFTSDDMKSALLWETCAVGEGMARYAEESLLAQYMESGGIVKFFARFPKLRQLGADFASAILRSGNRGEATVIYEKIQRYIRRHVTGKTARKGTS